MLMNEWDGDCTASWLQAAGGEKYIATIHLDTSNCLREGGRGRRRKPLPT